MEMQWEDWHIYETTGTVSTPAKCVPCGALMLYDHTIVTHRNGKNHKANARKKLDSIITQTNAPAKRPYTRRAPNTPSRGRAGTDDWIRFDCESCKAPQSCPKRTRYHHCSACGSGCSPH